MTPANRMHTTVPHKAIPMRADKKTSYQKQHLKEEIKDLFYDNKGYEKKDNDLIKI